MANIIIPPEHQSAPKRSVRLNAIDTRPPVSRDPRPSWETYDSEMDMTTAVDSETSAEAAEFAQRHLLKSPDQTIEAELSVYEKNYSDWRVKQQRWDGQERWQGRENEEMRLVNILHCDSFIRRLRRAGVEASHQDPFEWYRDNGIPVASWPRPRARLWLNSFVALISMKDESGNVRKVSSGRIGITAWVKGQPTTVTTLQYPYSPEYTIMRFDHMNVPTDERYRGWRTALLVLVRCEVITEEEAERAFGPALGIAGDFYREQMWRRRRIALGLAREGHEQTAL